MSQSCDAAPRLLRADEVKERLGLGSVYAVYRAAREGRIGGVVRMGRSLRFHEEELERWLRAGGTAHATG